MLIKKKRVGGAGGRAQRLPPAMRTKKEAHRHMSRWISIKLKWAQGKDDAYEKAKE